MDITAASFVTRVLGSASYFCAEIHTFADSHIANIVDGVVLAIIARATTGLQLLNTVPCCEIADPNIVTCCLCIATFVLTEIDT